MIRSKHSLFYFLVLVILFTANFSESQEANESSTTKGDDDDYIDLVDMTDDELEEICTSRGFELVREDGQVYTHEDYVDAASECLQIETDLEEILQKNPQILEDVKREAQRMKDERDRLQSQLDEMQADETIPGNETQEDHTSTQPESHVNEGNEEESNVDEDNEIQNIDDNQEQSDNTKGNTTETETTSNNQPMYNFKEITMEVIEQMKADVVKVKNLLIPERLQKQIAPILEKHVVPVLKEFTEQNIKPAVKSLVSVAQGMSSSVKDLIKRHATAFMNKSGGGGEEQSPATESE